MLKRKGQVVGSIVPGSTVRLTPGQLKAYTAAFEAISPEFDELRQMQEQYLPISADGGKKRSTMNAFRTGEQNRRRGPRFRVEGGADLFEVGGRSSLEGLVKQISDHGCLISTSDLLVPGTGLRLSLNIYDVSVALKGNVKYTTGDRTMGVEFQEIRQGDRPLLEYVMAQAKKCRNDFADLEVVTENLVAVAG